ncbi:MAG: DUF4837 family protein [Flavobacteriaceae bacterium]
MKNLCILGLILISLISCNNKNEIILQSSIGKYNSLLVIIDDTKWEGIVGDSIRAVVARDLIGFTQPEATFSISQIAPENFANLLKPSRNILQITKGSKNEMTSSKNKFAAPQQIVSLKMKDNEGLFQLLNKHADEIVSTFRNSDFKIFKNKMGTKTWDVKNLETFKNIKANITIPYAYRKVYDTLNYVWFKRDVTQGRSLNLQMYTLPITNEADLNGENIITQRNIKGKQYVVGSKSDMYMITEEAFSPSQVVTEIANRKTYETRGTWEMKNDFMAGPFLNYTVVDKKNNRLIVIEGFAFAPNVKKRDFMFELEAILKTLVVE